MAASNPSPCTQIVAHPPSPASSLLPELLLNIFEHLVARSSPTILLRICRRWADIASSVSSLWTRIDFSTPPTPLLQRSTDLPIEVDLSFSPDAPTVDQLMAAKEVLSLHCDRIRKLVLDLSVRCLKKVMPEFQATFPILEDVTIAVLPTNHCSIPTLELPGWTPFAAPSTIRYLRLLFVKAPWVTGHFRNLAEFFLHEQRYDDPPMEVFLGVLESSPQLTVLSVANAGPQLPRDNVTLLPVTRIVHLPNLQQLYLEQGDARDVGWILIHLNIPVFTNVRILVDLSEGDQVDVPLHLVFDLALPDHHGFPHLTNPHCCTYAVDNRPSCTIIAPNFAFRAIWDDDDDDHYNYFLLPFLRRVTAAGAIEDLSIISDVDTQYSLSEWNWNEIFGALGSLRKLRVKQAQDDSAFPISELLQSQLCPTLRDLELSCVVFGGEREGEWLGDPVVDKLVDCCVEQDRRGHRLEHLVIEAPSNVPPNLASLLALHVGYVEIRGDVLRDEIVENLEFGSGQVFDSLRACGHDKSYTWSKKFCSPRPSIYTPATINWKFVV